MSELGDDFKEIRRINRNAKEPARMDYTRAELLKRGCKVEAGPDGFRSYRVTFPGGRRFVFWPYSGWFQGKTQGRGFAELLKAGEAQP